MNGITPAPENRQDALTDLARRARRVAESHQHFMEDHADPGTEALGAQYELVNALSALPSGDDLPTNPTEAALRIVLALLDEWDSDITPGEIRAAINEALPRDDKSDRRRRIYLDGKGEAWVDAASSADGTPWIGCVVASGGHWPASDVAAQTGSLREIGRCW